MQREINIKKVWIKLHITMIVAANYRDAIFTSVVKVTYFMCGNKKDLFPVIKQHIALEKSVTNCKSVDV